MSEILLLSVFSGWETYSWESLNNIPQITQTYNGAKSCTGGSSLFSYKHIIPYCTVFMLRSIRQDRRKLSGKLIRCYCRNYNCFNLEDCMFLNIQTMSLPQFSSVQSLVMSDSLQPHDPQQARPPCPSPTPRVYPNSCPLIQWCHPTVSSSVVPFSSCPQSFPASGSFQMSQPFASGVSTSSGRWCIKKVTSVLRLLFL